MSIWQYKKNNPKYLVSNYLVKNNYNNFFYVGNKNFFTFNSTEIHLYDKIWYEYYEHRKVMYIPFKIDGNLVKLKIASTHTLNLYS